jgi:hypothetical protein
LLFRHAVLDRRYTMSLSKRVTLAAAVLGALVASSVAVAAGGLTGTYATTVSSPPQLKGRWSLILTKGGAYSVRLNGQAVARGTYTSTPKTITFDREQGSGCTGAGTYAWTRSGKTMTFVRKRETSSCKARALVLGHRFTQVG